MVIGGQSLVLLVALLVTPVAYSLFDDLQRRHVVAGALGWLRAKRFASEPATSKG